MSVAVSLGTVPSDQSGCQTAYSAGFTRQFPAFIHIFDDKLHDVSILDRLIPESGAFYIIDRGYLDFTRLQVLYTVDSHFVLRAKKNTRYQRVYSQPVDRSTGVLCDQRVRLTGPKTKDQYSQLLRRIRYRVPNTTRVCCFSPTTWICVPSSGFRKRLVAGIDLGARPLTHMSAWN